jgi:prophage regulatory protein
MQHECKAPSKILRIRQVQARTGLGRSSIYEKLNKNSSRYDEDFPRKIKIGISAIGFLESSVDAWIDNQVKMSNAR